MRICVTTDGGSELGVRHLQQSSTFMQELGSHVDSKLLTKGDEALAAPPHVFGHKGQRTMLYSGNGYRRTRSGFAVEV